MRGERGKERESALEDLGVREIEGDMDTGRERE